MLKIMLVDDHEPSLFITASLLKSFGYTVITAINGAEALDKIRQDAPDVIVSDILMPVMDGYTLCRELKQDDQLKNIPVIFVSATYVEPQDKKLGLSLGAESYIVKTQKADEFMEELQEVIQKCMDTGHITPVPDEFDEEFSEKYIEALNRKLQQKILQLEETNRRLYESEERLRRVVGNMPVMMDAFDEDYNIIAWNQECERVTGYSAEEMMGNPRSLEILYPDAEYREQMIAELVDLGFDFRNKEYTLTCKDGTKKTISWSNISARFPIPGWHTWAIGVDVTERKQAAEELAKHRKHLEHLVQERTRELEARTKELETFNKAMIDREMRIIEMKEEVNRLCEELGREPVYPPVWK
jgi:PAS domain S-box-containing protein